MSSMEQSSMEHMETAILAGGCFWCLEASFLQVKGVVSAVSGYTGGKTINPSYKEVCEGVSGHAEAVKIEFNPDIIAFEDILEIFFFIHDPTTLNRQGNDIGTQYRSAIFYNGLKQKKTAKDFIKRLEDEKIYSSPIVTRLEPASIFYKAEDYHQNYYNNNPLAPYCSAVVGPKVKKFEKKFEKSLKDK